VSALRPLRVAVGFLTRIPVPRRDASEEDLVRALAFFPVVGLLLGALLAGTAWLARDHLPGPAVGVVLTTLLALVTGGLHLDGLADVFDGLGGGRGSRDRTLAIMRDSRIGAHGAVALILDLGGKIAALGALADRGEFRAIVAFPMLARWIAVLLIALFPYARPEGIGRAFARGSRGMPHLVATLVVGAALGGLGPRVILPALAAIALALAFSAFLSRRLGGLTGDAYGAAIELSELAFLLACLHRT